MKGWVYILANPAMPDIVKIGMTTNTPEARANDLSRATGVPLPFAVMAQMYSPDCAALECAMHASLAEVRVNAMREFFRINLFEACQKLEDLHREQVEEWLGEFLPDHYPVEADEIVDIGTLAEAAHANDLASPEVAQALMLLSAEELKPAAERLRTLQQWRLAEWKAQREAEGETLQ